MSEETRLVVQGFILQLTLVKQLKDGVLVRSFFYLTNNHIECVISNTFNLYLVYSGQFKYMV